MLKVLRHMTCSLDQYWPGRYTYDKGESIDEKVRKYINNDKEINNSDGHTKMPSLCGVTQPWPDLDSSNNYISSYVLKTLVLFEWRKSP